MKKKSLIFVSVFFLLAITTVHAMENEKEQVLGQFKGDVTGNGEEEHVFLKGVTFSSDPTHFEKVLIEVVGNDGKNQSIEVNGGFRPELTLKDFNHDGIKDLFVSVETDGSGAIKSYYMYTLKDSKPVEITAPEPLVVQSELLDRYKAKITIENNHKTHKFQLKSKADEYEQMGLYMNGKLNEPMELIIGDYDRLEPVKIKGKKIGLKGNQMISGAAHSDVLGRVESTWVLKDGEWKLLGTKVFEIKKQ